MTEKMIIEARVNEYAPRERNSHVPWTAEQIAADAAACREAGAAIVHFHPRTDSGEPDLSFEANQAILRQIRDRSDILIHPTLGAAAQVSDPHVRIENIVRLCAAGLAPDFGPIDTGSSNADVLDPTGTAFATEGIVYANPTDTLRVFADTLRRVGVKPYLHVWNVVYLRIAATLYRLGLLEGPLWAGFCVSGDDAPIHHPATASGLAAYVDNIPTGLPVIWAVNGFHCDVLALAPQIIDAGGHIAIGLGDHHYAERGAPTNADLIAQVARLARERGREPAAPNEVKRLLGIA